MQPVHFNPPDALAPRIAFGLFDIAESSGERDNSTSPRFCGFVICPDDFIMYGWMEAFLRKARVVLRTSNGTHDC
jgi:hypothetical protein